MVLVGAGCGGPSAAQRAQARSQQLDRIAPELQDRLSRRAADAKTACQNAIGDFLDGISGLDSRLDVGLNFSDYSREVSDAKVAHDRIDVTAISGNCLTAAVAAESALEHYITAYNTWNNCVSDAYCSNDSITPSLQSQWAKATRQDERAREALGRIAGASSIQLGSRSFPRTSAETDETIYGTIVSTVCTNPPDPPAAAKPCDELQNTIAGGVSAGEESKVDGEVRKLVDALGLNP